MIGDFNQLLDITPDLELLAGDTARLRMYIENVGFDAAAHTKDSYNRNLWHLTTIYGNEEGFLLLEHLAKGRDSFVKATDKYGYNCGHFAGRNGHLRIFQYLAKNVNGFNFDLEDGRFDTTALSLAIAMKHHDCTRFLVDYVGQKTLDQALISACSEGFLDIAELLLNKNARLV